MRALASLAVPLGLLLSLAAPAIATAAPADDDAEDASSRVTTRVTAEGLVIAQVRVAASPALVREQLAGAEKAHRLAPTTISVKATPDGACEKLQLSTRGLLSPFHLETRRCPTSTGWRETLVRSSDFKEYWNEWTVKADGTGTLVTFTTRTLPDVAVPESIIFSQTRRVLAKLMRGLVGALGEH
ncbi:MAG: hypothetical protein H0T76_04430 [Nannocystis sp.]|nr:hypothetical protein [Nannocystis sp.]MBA3545709.1 hypothetical protein [Nannocystis sp.]